MLKNTTNILIEIPFKNQFPIRVGCGFVIKLAIAVTLDSAVHVA
jgi:hypothetical protein